jgi:hypothetical protein
MRIAIYKRRRYRLLWSGRTRYGERAHLEFMDGSKSFWAPADLVATRDEDGEAGSGGCVECGKQTRGWCAECKCTLCWECSDRLDPQHPLCPTCCG